jgi:hypothetical protein
MAFLTIAGVTVEVLVESSAKRNQYERIGRSARSHAGNLRSTQRATKRSWTWQSEPLTLAEIATLEAAAPDGTFQSCGGEALDNDTIECQVLYGDMPYEENVSGVSFRQTITITLIEV